MIYQNDYKFQSKIFKKIKLVIILLELLSLKFATWIKNTQNEKNHENIHCES